MRPIFAFAVLASMANLAFAQAPELKFVEAVDKDKGTIVVQVVQNRVVPVQKLVQKLQNGVVVTEAVTAHEYQRIEMRVLIHMANARVITPDGKQLPIDEVWKRAKAGTVVAVAGSSQTPAEAFRRVISNDTLIIIPAPIEQRPAPPPPPPEPIPI